ncbi:GntR family transcriptional regulator [Sphingomonas metalli]|uniref:GntR family transcriptional regulator n=1 Tax=Sphingomonas metalli TaxID=1779358 RepID=A0A916WX39_9SPHN|nr:FadR/GntR family transcriptional regulator [Sphingomonas metalli]GGB39259.1 GntR family transcriptional regulator [Sphingomonas metalli]
MSDPARDLPTEARRRPAHAQVAREMGIAIVTGRYPPGSNLPGEHEIAARRGIARSVVREALRMLGAKGLLESKPRAGTRVRDRAEWNLLDPDLLAWMFEGEPPADFVRSLFQLRLIVEPAAAELAAVTRTPAQLAAMDEALDQMALHGLATPEGQAADQRFHHLVLHATQNELLVSLAVTIGSAVRWTTIYKYRNSRHPRDPMPEHRLLYDAIAAQDPAAARAATVTLITEAEAATAAIVAQMAEGAG